MRETERVQGRCPHEHAAVASVHAQMKPDLEDEVTKSWLSRWRASAAVASEIVKPAASAAVSAASKRRWSCNYRASHLESEQCEHQNKS